MFLKLSPLGQVEENNTSRYTGRAGLVNNAQRQAKEKVGTTGPSRSPKKESRTPESRNRGRNTWPGEKKGSSAGWEPMSTRGSKRGTLLARTIPTLSDLFYTATRRSSFCQQCLERGISCKSSGRSALICIQCAEARLSCSLKPPDPVNRRKKPAMPQFRRPPSPSGFSSSPLTELDDESEKDGSVFSISNETDISDDLDYVSGTEDLDDGRKGCAFPRAWSRVRTPRMGPPSPATFCYPYNSRRD